MTRREYGLALALLAAGCGAASSPPLTPGDAERVPLARGDDEIVDTASGERITWAELAADLDDVRVVYVGERHDAAVDHEVQRAVIAALHARDGSIAIGVEMVQRPFQAPLDAWIAGAIDEAELLRTTEWAERWNLDFALYRPIFELARAESLRLIALNARRELTRAIAREGEGALTPELRAELPAIDRDDPAHRAMIMAAFGDHPEMDPPIGSPAPGPSVRAPRSRAVPARASTPPVDPSRLERFYLAQLVWDEAMAEAVARTLDAPDAPRRMIVLAGRMHVQRGLGIPRRAARRGAEPFRVILPLTEAELEDAATLCDYAVVVPE